MAANCTLPVGLAGLYFGLAALHVARVALPVGFAALPVGPVAIPVVLVALPVGFTALLVGIAALPVGLAALPVCFAALPAALPGLPVGFAALPVGLRGFMLLSRLFRLVLWLFRLVLWLFRLVLRLFLFVSRLFRSVLRSHQTRKTCTATSPACPPKLLSVISSFHNNMKGTVNYDGATSEPFDIHSGVKQGCVFAPTLFSIFFSMMLSYAFNTSTEGVFLHTRADGKLFNLARLRAKTKVRHVVIREMLFTDDAALVTHTMEYLQQLIDRLSHAFKEFGLIISI